MKKILRVALAFVLAVAMVVPVAAAKLAEPVTEFEGQALAFQDWDKKAAQALTKQPGAIKIPSNAHSDVAIDLGIVFHWNVKQKNDCVLSVSTLPDTLNTYYSFDLLVQSSGAYRLAKVDGPGVYQVAKDAKNINMVYLCNLVKHEFAQVNLDKKWLDAKGEPMTADTPNASFTGGYKLGSQLVEVPCQVAFGEVPVEGYELVGITVAGDKVEAVNFAAQANQVYDIVFTNQALPEEEGEDKEVNVSKSSKIASQAQSNYWK